MVARRSPATSHQPPALTFRPFPFCTTSPLSPSPASAPSPSPSAAPLSSISPHSCCHGGADRRSSSAGTLSPGWIRFPHLQGDCAACAHLQLSASEAAGFHLSTHSLQILPPPSTPPPRQILPLYTPSLFNLFVITPASLYPRAQSGKYSSIRHLACPGAGAACLLKEY